MNKLEKISDSMFPENKRKQAKIEKVMITIFVIGVGYMITRFLVTILFGV